MSRIVIPVWVLALVLALAPLPLASSSENTDAANITIDPAALKGLSYRSLNFGRGGRSTAVTGVPGDPMTYYFGSTGGGVWKTTDGGNSWRPISDGFFGGSIGAIAVAPSDSNVVYVGTGSTCPRGNISAGVGAYRSTDAGRTWTHIGLPEAGQIGRIEVHPKDHNLVYAAVLGHIFGPNEERGVYRSNDGGASWEKVLFVSERTGAVDLSMDPSNPRILYAAMWTTERKPWTIISGSEEGGLYRSSDGGDTWKKVEGGGFPAGVVGRIGVDVSPADPNRIFAIVEAEGNRGGIYRSDNGGDSWRNLNRERRFRQRAWYYTHIYADPVSANTVYVLNTGFYRSTDGGSSYESFRTPHGDNHDLWINPTNPQFMINGNDGGANVSFNGARSWSRQDGQPTAEFYRVTVDSGYPYRVYGAQQDNSTASVSSRGAGGGRGGSTFYSVGGGESGHIAVDPRGNHIVYAGSYGGTISRTDTNTRMSRSVRAYPDSQTGQQAADMKYRFQWNAPIRLSPHNPDVVYHTSQHVHRSADQGTSWEIISPDLTRNDKGKQDYSGGPITRDNTGVEVYSTIFAFEESPHQPNLMWAGSDDGKVHISRDGRSWDDITPPDMPDFGVVNMVDLSAHDPGRAHIAVYRYRQDDFTPYIFQTSDYGRTWKRLTDGTNGIPADHFVRVVREDPHRKGLLYAGTEFGMYISFDDGAHWQSFQLNLPVTPITDLAVHRNDLVVATQGRAFWILDDVTALHELNAEVTAAAAHLFTPRDSLRGGLVQTGVNYYLKEEPSEPVKIEILNSSDEVIGEFTSRRGGRDRAGAGGGGGRRGGGRFGRFGGGGNVSANAGMNRFTWSQRHKSLFTVPEGIVMWGGGGRGGPQAVPGDYKVRLTVGDWSDTRSFTVKPDPRLDATSDDYAEQHRMAVEVGTQIDRLYDDLLKIRDIKQQVGAIARRASRAGFGDELRDGARALSDKLTEVEGELTQLEGEGGQDALNFPGRLDNQWIVLYGDIAGSPGRPRPGAYDRLKDLQPQLDTLLARLKEIYDKDLQDFNKLVKDKKIPAVIIGG